MEKISIKDMDLIGALKDYIADSKLSAEYKYMYGWGIDFAYCDIIRDDGAKDRVLMAVDNHDGTGTIRTGGLYEKYIDYSPSANEIEIKTA
jgi:hypothetical protein